MAHLGLMWVFFSSGGAGAVSDSINEKKASQQISVVEMLIGPPDVKTEIVERKTTETNKASSAVADGGLPLNQHISASPSLHSALYYFSAKELTRKPLIMRDIPENLTLNVPTAPPQAAILRMLINEYGDIDRIIVEDTALPDSAREMVIDSFSRMRFHPGEINGIPVRSQLRIEVMLNEFDEAQ